MSKYMIFNAEVFILKLPFQESAFLVTQVINRDKVNLYF